MADEDDTLRTIKVGLLEHSDPVTIRNIKDVATRASKVWYLATTYLRHDMYDRIINDRPIQLPVTPQTIAPYWYEVSILLYLFCWGC